jgi:phenylalanine--tRNA ligase, alpha subunit
MLEDIKEKIKKVANINELYNLKLEYLGKKGRITEMMASLKELTIEQKKIEGQKINEIKKIFNEIYTARENEIKEKEKLEKLENERIDLTLPGLKFKTGGAHPLLMIQEELEEVFKSMGYIVVKGPEVEKIDNNFTYLNIEENHPSRSSSDTFYIDDDILLRTQTSAMQVRFMTSMEEKKPFKLVCPGKVYRKDDDDMTHSHEFHQMEALVVDYKSNLTNLKNTLENLVKNFFNTNGKIRFRPSFFPFTEPSYEVDIECFKCGGKGCSTCKNTGFIEVLGAGMVHPNVLKNCGFDPEKFQGFAFGIGLERLAMFRYQINDVRDFYINDLRFNRNFKRMKGDE